MKQSKLMEKITTTLEELGVSYSLNVSYRDCLSPLGYPLLWKLRLTWRGSVVLVEERYHDISHVPNPQRLRQVNAIKDNYASSHKIPLLLIWDTDSSLINPEWLSRQLDLITTQDF